LWYVFVTGSSGAGTDGNAAAPAVRVKPINRSVMALIFRKAWTVWRFIAKK